MSRIPPHEARMIGAAWPASQHRNGSPHRVRRATHVVLHGVTRLGRTVHVLRPESTHPANTPPLTE